MTELSFDDPCVLFALRRESQGFLRDFHPQQHFPGAPCRARFCGPEWLSVLVLETGVGPRAALPALEWLLDGPVLGKVPYRPRVVISAGFAGALREDLRVGDVILATEVVDVDGGKSNKLVDEWDAQRIDVPLKMLYSPYREVIRPIVQYAVEIREANPRGVVAVYIPEYVVGRWWEQVLHNQTALILKSRLLFRPNTIVISIPAQIE